MTRRWALDRCKAFFGLSDADEALIRGERGRAVLLDRWRMAPEAFYEWPLQILRQEWFHAAQAVYPHGGFWAALGADALLLDYGCGTAEVARLPWIARGGHIVLIEPGEACRAYLAYKYAELLQQEYPIHITGGLWGKLMVDALICTDVFEHVPNPLDVQKQLWAFLKPGGHALLSFETVYPHPGHLAESIAQFQAWQQWLFGHGEIIERERYVWIRKPS